MAVSILSMPAFRSPGNAGFNWQPVAAGLDSIRQQKNQNALMDQRYAQMDQQEDQFEAGQELSRERMAAQEKQNNAILAMQKARMDQGASEFSQSHGLAQRRFGMAEETHREALKSKLRNGFAGLAQMVQQEQDPARRSQMWQQFTSADKRIMEGLPPELQNDPVLGSKYIIAQARGYQNKQSNDYSKNPIYGADANGKPIVMQLSPTGEAIQTRLPAGVTVDAGGVMARTQGKSQGEARIVLPAVEREFQRVEGYVNKVLNHPAFERSTSTYSGWQPNLTASARDFESRVEQLKGKAFVSAFQRMKGAGAITETEGAKAGEALARLQQTSVGSENYTAAVNDFLSEMRLLRDIARQKAGGTYAGQAPAAPADNDPLGIR